MRRKLRADGYFWIGVAAGVITLLAAVLGLLGEVFEWKNNKLKLEREAQAFHGDSVREERSVPGGGAPPDLRPDSHIPTPPAGQLLESVAAPQAEPRVETPLEPLSRGPEDERAAEPSEPVSAVPEANRAHTPPNDPHVKVMHDYRFELLRCEASRPLVTCRLTITSLQGDRQLMIGGFSYLSTRDQGIRSVGYTAEGMDYFPTEASLGSRSEHGAPTGFLVEGLPMAATVVFDRVPAGTRAFRELRVAFSSDSREFLVPFESVPIR